MKVEKHNGSQGDRSVNPPLFWLKLLRWFCHQDYIEDIEGDLVELYQKRYEVLGRKKANTIFRLEILKLFRPSLIKPLEGFSKLNYYGMLKNYLVVAFRVIKRESFFSVVNIIGLVIGLTCVAFIYLWVHDEFIYNTYPPQSEKIARILVNNPPDEHGHIQTWRGIPYPLKTVLEENHDEFTQIGVLSENYPVEFNRNGNSLTHDGLFINTDAVKMLGMNLIKGRIDIINDEPSSLLISEDFALSYFGSNWFYEDILNKPVETMEYGSFKVAAVYQNLPVQSTVQFDFALSSRFAEINEDALNQWGIYTYRFLLKLNDHISFDEADQRVKNLLSERKKDIKVAHTLFLQPFEDSYLYDNFENGKISGGRIEYIRLLIVFGILMLVVTLANFSNLTVARLAKRVKESGIRKTLGALKSNLQIQFLLESVLISLIASLISWVLVYSLIGYFNIATGKIINVYFVKYTLLFYFLFIGFAGGFLAGLFPSFYMSSIHAIKALKGGLFKTPSVNFFRKALMIVQFFIAVIMITSALIIYKQVDFLFNKNLGMTKEDIIIMDVPRLKSANEFFAYKDEILSNPDVSAVSLNMSSPFQGPPETSDVSWQGNDRDNPIVFKVMNTDPDFIPVTGIKVKSGRNFSWELRSDSANYLINETAAQMIGEENILGKELDFWGVKGNIIGVVEDFHMESLFKEIMPLVIRNDMFKAVEKLYVRLGNQNREETIRHIENINKKHNPERVFTFNYLVDEYKSKYASETQIKRIVTWFALIACILSCIGLLGLISYSVYQRKKEIALRKVLGAPLLSIFGLLSASYVALIFISLLLGLPLSFYMMENYLSRYAYHINIDWKFVAVTTLFFFAITMLTIIYHVFKAVLNKPINDLRAE